MRMNLQEFKKQIGDKNGNYPEKICDNYCKYPEIVNNKGYSEDKFFEVLNTEYCDDCPINQLFMEVDKNVE